MPDPNLELYDDGGTIISSGNKVNFGSVEKGVTGDTIVLYVWNDKTGALGSDTAVAPRLYVSHTAAIADILAGTAANGNVSMIEARSCAGVNVAGDAHTAWTPVGPGSLLTMGNIPSDAAKQIEIRLNVPQDAPDVAVADFNIELSY